MMLTVCLVIHSASTAPISESGMLITTMNALRQSRRNSRIIKPGQHRAQRAFQRQAADGARHVGRLVEFVAHLHVRRAARSGTSPGSALTRLTTDSVEASDALGDRDIDRAPAVDQGVAGHDVRAVHHGADIAHEDRRIDAGADRHALQVLDVLDHRIQRHHRILAADGHVAGRADEVGRGDGGDDLIRRHVVGAQPVGLQVDDDAAGAAAEGRRRRHARQRGEERAHAVQRQVLHLAHRPRLRSRTPGRPPARCRRRSASRTAAPFRAA